MMAAVIPFHRKLANRITMEVVTLSPCFSRKLLSLQWLPLLQLQYQRTRLRFARVATLQAAMRSPFSIQMLGQLTCSIHSNRTDSGLILMHGFASPCKGSPKWRLGLRS